MPAINPRAEKQIISYTMLEDDIKQLIESNMPNSIVKISGDGRHFAAIVISSVFEGMSLLARQRHVYQTLGDNISTGKIHALTIKAKTPIEWDKEINIHG